MAALISSDFEIPAEISTGIFEKAQKGSTLAQLSGARPQKFGKQQVFVLTAPPKAELVGEAKQKSPTPAAYASKTVNPFKLQVTMRFSQEVQWADEDVQIGVLNDLASNAGIALGRALDLVGIHKINPLTGTVSSLVKEGLIDSTQKVELVAGKYDEAIEGAAALVIASGYTPTGVAMDGIDIASHQTGIDLTVVPCDFVIIKATEGATYVNPDYARAYQQAKSAGKCLGIYHYASGGNVQTEADHFLQQVGNRIGEAVLILDWESYTNPAFGVNDHAWVKSWCDYVKGKTGVAPVVYVQQSAMSRLSGIGNYGLWVAQYADMNPTGYQATPWNEGAYSCVMRQYSSCGRLNGYGGNLDLNKFYGDRVAWNKYAGKGNAAKPTETSKPVANTPGGSAGVVFTYGVREGGRILPFVNNLEDFAGIQGTLITDVAIKVNKGSVKYRVHVKDGDWLPYVTGCNWNDPVNGYAGNGQVIDAIEVYYYTPEDVAQKYGYQKAQYRVSPVNGNYYSWQYDNEIGNGQDGYAGCFGVAIDRLQLF